MLRLALIFAIGILFPVAQAAGFECLLPAGYETSAWTSPHKLSGDFDSDQNPDTAELVVQRTSGKKGIAICLSTLRKLVFIGAGTATGAGGDNFDWMNDWEIYRTDIWQKDRAPKLTVRDALRVSVKDGPGGIVYFNNTKFLWIQFGE